MSSQTEVSLNLKAWRRLRKNKAAMAGLLLICLSVVVALSAYLIAPDRTEDGDLQILETATRKPGFSIDVAREALDIEADSRSFISRWWSGQKKEYKYYPIKGYRIEGTDVVLLKYNGEDRDAEEIKKSMVEMLFAQSVEKNEIVDDGKSLRFYGFNNEAISVDKAQLAAEFEKQCIDKKTYWLGSDKYGRDVLSRLIIGIRISLVVGIISVVISLVIGIVMGALAGYFRGWVDDLIMWFINVFWSIPTFLLALALFVAFADFFDNKLVLIFIAVGLTMWVSMARIVRGQFMSLREKEFVEASRALGFTHARTIFKHILPNVMGPVIVIVCANFANAILVEAGLSFIGLGVQPPTPSWGGILNEHKDFLDGSKAFLTIFPGLCIMLLVLSFNLLGNGLRDALDVRGRL